MNDFLEKLDKYFETHEGTEEDGLEWLNEDGDNEYEEVIYLCWEYLIRGNWFDDDGRKYLQNNGYKVYAGDKDSFGLLVVVVEKDGKAISFG